MSISGDRHLRPEPSGKLKSLITGPRIVLVRANESYAGTFAGQVLLQLLVNLLCRQFGVVDAVWLDVPPTGVDRRAFPLPIPEQDDLLGQLLVLGRAVGGGEVQISRLGSAQPASVTVLVGPGVEPQSESAFTMVAFGDGWDAFCSPIRRSPESVTASDVPFGPLLAACLASGMVFRSLYQVASQQSSDNGLWDFGPGVWQNAGGPSPVRVRLPSSHLIGLGAVGAAFALSVASTPGLSGNLIGIDPQMTDETGRNRLLSALYHEIGQPKVVLAARLFEHTGISFYPIQTRWPDYVTDPTRNSPPDVRAEEEAFRYEYVISCVDRNIHRQNIARYLPRNVLSGSTDGLVAQATYYAIEGPCECLACNHPVPTFSLEDSIQELKGLTASDRVERYEAWGMSPNMQAAIDEYLIDPSCGQVAEAALRRLGVDSTTDWSVGFVSATAGVMLAAYLARCALNGVAATVGDRPERRLIFLGAQELSSSRARRKSDCPVCGDVNKRDRFARRWGIRH